MSELVINYNRKKIVIKYMFRVMCLLILLISFILYNQWQLFTVISFAALMFATIFYGYTCIKEVKCLPFFIRCDSKGIYTNESFVFCEWKNIKELKLERYMGYQTLFFQIDRDIKSKFKPIKKNGLKYYCIPLADCEKKPTDVLQILLKFKENI